MDKLRADAETDYAEQIALGLPEPYHSISAFGIQIDERDAEDQMRELCTLIQRSAKWVTFTTSGRLADEGFEIRVRQPPAHHYDVVIGDTLDDTRIAVLTAILSEHDRRRFPTCTT